MKIFQQGWLDCLCGVYSIVNAEKIINGSSDTDSQELFNAIIEYLSRKRILKTVMLNGVTHKIVSRIMNDVIGDLIPYQQTNKKNFYLLNDWWNYSKEFLEEEQRRVIILSVDGRDSHITVIRSMSDAKMLLCDSSGGKGSLRKTSFRMQDYKKKDKYVIYPAQCWYLGMK